MLSAYDANGTDGLRCRQDPRSYRDETAVFNDDPHAFVNANFTSTVITSFTRTHPSILESWTYSWPSHLVVFERLLDRADATSGQSFNALLRGKGYREQKRLWNSFWHEEPMRAGDIVIFMYVEVLEAHGLDSGEELHAVG